MMKKVKKIMIAILIASILFFFFGYFYSQRVVYVFEEMNTEEEINIAHITDTHFRNNYHESRYDKILETINSEEVDLIVFTGDLFQVEDISLELEEGITKIFSSLDCDNKLAVLGNHDLRSERKRDTVIRILEKSGFIVLVNEDVTLTINDTLYHFIGLDDYSLGNREYSDILETSKEYEHNYVLTHEPDTFDDIYPLDVIAVFAGHSHGGQVRLPLIGEILMVYGAKNYPDHYYLKEDTEMFTSFGLGDSGIPFRFFTARYVNFYSNS